jgi:elongation factor P hydroxylase
MNIGALCSSVNDIFLDVGTKEYNTIIFLGTDEYIYTKEDTIFSCSVAKIQHGTPYVFLLLSYQTKNIY